MDDGPEHGPGPQQASRAFAEEEDMEQGQRASSLRRALTADAREHPRQVQRDDARAAKRRLAEEDDDRAAEQR